MNIVSIQKVIKVGDSLAVTIPAKDAKYYGVQHGEELEARFSRPVQSIEQHEADVVALTQQLIARHKKALLRLANR